MTFAREAWPFVVPFAALAAILLVVGRGGWALAAAAAGLLVLLFFRNPRRVFQGRSTAVLAAADGVVTAVDLVEDPALGPERYHRVVTFLSVFDVHVQRAPVAGRVAVSSPHPGRKVAAFRAAAGQNESHLTVIERPGGDRVAVRQIAGLLARRVVCYLAQGQEVERGQVMGLIKFGSRVDVLMPESYRVQARRGQRLATGRTPIAEPEEPE